MMVSYRSDNTKPDGRKDILTVNNTVGPLLVDKKELEAIGKESMELPSRPGKHLAKLAVFHQLHCLVGVFWPYCRIPG